MLPCTWTFLSSLGKSAFFSIVLEARIERKAGTRESGRRLAECRGAEGAGLVALRAKKPLGDRRRVSYNVVDGRRGEEHTWQQT